VIVSTIAALFQFELLLDEQIFDYFANSAYVIIPGALVIVASRLSLKLWKIKHADAKPVLWFTIGIVSLFTGEQLWTIYKDFLGIEPFPSEADFFYLAFYPLFSAFFLHYLRSHKKFLSNKIILFGFAISASLLLPSIIATYDLNSEETNLGIIVALAYPLVDVVILGFAVINTMFLFQEGRSYFWVMVTLGVFVWILANIMFLYAEINEIYYDGYSSDILWLAAYTLWTFALLDYTKKLRINPSYLLAQIHSRRVKFGAINQIAIPVVVGTIIIFSVLALMVLGGLDPENLQNNQASLVILTFVIIITFSAVILAMNRNLTRLVKIKEEEIAEKNTQLLRAEKLTAIGEVSARIAHDIRNPLSTIKNSTELILYRHKDHLTKDDDMMMTKIKRATSRITHQIDDVLDFVKEKDITVGNYNVMSLLQTALADVLPTEKVTINVMPTNLAINCDAEQIHRVFVNLIINAMQAMRDQGTITVRTKENSEYIILEFEDSGPGISDDMGDKIFEPLITTKQSGTGLGLAICKRIVEQHGGTISYKNKPTTFIIKIPKQIHI
jgi:signal transduction histidine kinase